MQVTSEAIQRWVRVAMYYVFGGVGMLGFTPSGSAREMIISVVGFAATAAWTKYGSSLNSMLTEVQKTAGVEKVDVKVDPTVIKPSDINAGTPDAVTAKPA